MSAEGWVSLITGGAGAVTVLVTWLLCLLSGKIHTDSEFDREVQRGDLLQRALNEKDEALKAANERATAAVRASELIADAFTEVKQRQLPRGRSHGS